jgi:glycerol uptake facilitator-like aquaporin
VTSLGVTSLEETSRPSLAVRAAAEGIGSAFLLAAVVGSGVMGERLAGGNGSLALLANTLATGAMLVALISALGPISGAHFNPAVTLVAWARRAISPREGAIYVLAQIGGAILGVVAAHAMFDLELLSASAHDRTGWRQWSSEFVATSGLLLVVAGCSGPRAAMAPIAVGSYVAAGYWFTASTCFANPAVTIARGLTSSFAGIRSRDVPGFLLAQLLATGVALAVCRRLEPPRGSP